MSKACMVVLRFASRGEVRRSLRTALETQFPPVLPEGGLVSVGIRRDAWGVIDMEAQRFASVEEMAAVLQRALLFEGVAAYLARDETRLYFEAVPGAEARVTLWLSGGPDVAVGNGRIPDPIDALCRAARLVPSLGNLVGVEWHWE